MKQNRNETMVGLFVILAFIFLSLIVFFVSGVYLFRPGYSVTVMYDYVSILDKGAPVRLAGVRIGEVNKVTLVPDAASKKIRVQVKLFIENGTPIHENYQFVIQGTHILSEPHIEITPIPGDAPLIQNNAVIEGVTPIAIEALIDQAHSITRNLDAILSGFKGAVNDPEGKASVKAILFNLSKVTESMNKVFSASEDDMKQAFVNMKTSTDALDNILNKMDKGEGTLGKLLTQDELYQELRDFVAEIKAHPWRLLKKDNGGKKFLFF